MSQVCLPWIIAQSFANDSPAARTALRTQFSQLQRTFPVSMPLRSRQMVAPQSSLKRGMIARDAAIAWAEGAADYLRDCIDLFEEEGWDWTYHAFREWTGWSVEHEAEKPGVQRPSFDNPRKRALLDGFRRGRPTGSG